MTINADLGGAAVPEWTVADRMRKAREYRGLSQTEFAAETGLSRRTISSIETGEKTPKTLDYNIWQFATGVSRAWLEFGVHPLGLEPRTH